MAEEFYLSVSPTPEQLAEYTTNADDAYAGYGSSINGVSTPLYTGDSFSASVPTLSTPPTAPTTSGGGNLLDVLKNNSNTSAKAMNDVAKVMHEGNIISNRSVRAIENMGANIQKTLSIVANVLNMGNSISNTHNNLYSAHQRVQSEKNYKQIEHMNYQSQGTNTLLDSKGDPIKPREVKAKYHAEKHMDEERMNKFDWGKALDNTKIASEEIANEGIELFEQLVQAHTLNAESMKKIDDEVSKIY